MVVVLVLFLVLIVVAGLASLVGLSGPLPAFLLVRTLGLLLTLWTGRFDAVGPATEDALVRPDRAEFIFGPAQRSTWEWNQPETRGTEYVWVVRVSSGGVGHELGAHLFAKVGSQPKHGSLAELIAACERSVAQLSDNRTKLIGTCHVTVDARNRVHVLLTDAAMIGKIFANRPAHVLMRIEAPHERVVDREVGVVYQGW